MKTALIALGAACFCLISLIGVGMTSINRFTDNKPMDLTARLDKWDICPGDCVRLEEQISSDIDAKVKMVLHHVVRIGRYDDNIGSLVNLDKEAFVDASAEHDFIDLPPNLSCNPFLPYSVTTPRTKGTEFEFRPRLLGIYLLTVEWILWIGEDKRTFSSNPVVLVVRPPKDAKGKPIVKPEWLRRNEKKG
jgi:hypothetical protein